MKKLHTAKTLDVVTKIVTLQPLPFLMDFGCNLKSQNQSRAVVVYRNLID